VSSAREQVLATGGRGLRPANGCAQPPNGHTRQLQADFALVQLPRRLVAVEHRHADVHQHPIEAVLLQQRQRQCAVVRHLHVEPEEAQHLVANEALDGDAPTHRFDDALAERQAEAGAAAQAREPPNSVNGRNTRSSS
jgi:hypothetical protein